MLARYSIDITFGKAVAVFKANQPLSRDDINARLRVQPFNDQESWHMLVDPNRGTNHVRAMLDDDFNDNREFAILVGEELLLHRAREFAIRLYDLSPDNYDEQELWLRSIRP